MIKLRVNNFKSIDALELELGRVNLFIGENGSGKTSILETVGMAAAGAAQSVSAGALRDRGIRVTQPRWMRSGFEEPATKESIDIVLSGAPATLAVSLVHDDTPFGEWHNQAIIEKSDELASTSERAKVFSRLARSLGNARKLDLHSFLTYAPREHVLRDLARDSHVEPIGVHGEGLFRLLQVLDYEGQLPLVKEQLAALGWFDDLSITSGVNPSSRMLEIRDIFLEGEDPFDQHSADEGFLFVLLYACLLISRHTPRIFAIDNVDTALNPKLCARIVRMFAELTQAHERRVLLTAHNPGILDGIDLQDDEQRLFVVYRNLEGKTRVRRILPVDVSTTDPPLRLSEAFLRGDLGALPTNF